MAPAAEDAGSRGRVIWIALAVLALVVLVCLDVRRITRRRDGARALSESEILVAGRPNGHVDIEYGGPRL